MTALTSKPPTMRATASNIARRNRVRLVDTAPSCHEVRARSCRAWCAAAPHSGAHHEAPNDDSLTVAAGLRPLAGGRASPRGSCALAACPCGTR